MPSNLSADERAAVEKVRDALDRKDLSDKELVVFDDEPLYPGSLFKPGEPVTYGDLRTLLAVVARAGEPVADASKNIAIANRLTVFARELGRDHPRYITLLNAALALENRPAHPPRAGSASGERGFREWPCGCSWNNGLVTRCAAHPPRAGEVTLTFSTGDSSVHLLAAAANIINGEMELMDVDNFTMQVKYRNYKRVRDALTAALAASRQERGT